MNDAVNILRKMTSQDIIVVISFKFEMTAHAYKIQEMGIIIIIVLNILTEQW